MPPPPPRPQCYRALKSPVLIGLKREYWNKENNAKLRDFHFFDIKIIYKSLPLEQIDHLFCFRYPKTKINNLMSEVFGGR